jgi:hypothetical protein
MRLPALAVLGFCVSAQAQPVTVTLDNFVRAETDMYFGKFVKEAGGLGKFSHARQPADVDKQTVVRMNRDTLYSFAVFDLDAGPVTVTLPEMGKRFMSSMVVNEDHYVVDVSYTKAPRTYTRDKVGTRYMNVVIRTLVDPADPKDVEQVHALQDGIQASQKAPGTFSAPSWDPESQKKVRDALEALGKVGGAEYTKAFGSRSEVDPVQHLIGTATGWGGNPAKDASYVGAQPARNDGTTVYKLVVKDVPVDGFWSISVYNAEGFFEKNAQSAYSVNNITGKKGADGSITIQFGGCNREAPNCLPVTKGWNYVARMYRPRAEILSGKWKFPEAQPL